MTFLSILREDRLQKRIFYIIINNEYANIILFIFSSTLFIVKFGYLKVNTIQKIYKLCNIEFGSKSDLSETFCIENFEIYLFPIVSKAIEFNFGISLKFSSIFQ